MIKERTNIEDNNEINVEVLFDKFVKNLKNIMLVGSILGTLFVLAKNAGKNFFYEVNGVQVNYAIENLTIDILVVILIMATIALTGLLELVVINNIIKKDKKNKKYNTDKKYIFKTQLITVVIAFIVDFCVILFFFVSTTFTITVGAYTLGDVISDAWKYAFVVTFYSVFCGLLYLAVGDYESKNPVKIWVKALPVTILLGLFLSVGFSIEQEKDKNVLILGLHSDGKYYAIIDKSDSDYLLGYLWDTPNNDNNVVVYTSDTIPMDGKTTTTKNINVDSIKYLSKNYNLDSVTSK